MDLLLHGSPWPGSARCSSATTRRSTGSPKPVPFSTSRARARPLLDDALRQFRALGMPGWIRRAEALGTKLAGGSDAA